jgi:hypothetical protein
MLTDLLNNALMLAEGPSGKDILDGLKAALELPPHFVVAGLIGVVIGLAAGAGVSSYCADKDWDNPADLGFLYWAACSVGGAFLVLLVSSP